MKKINELFFARPWAVDEEVLSVMSEVFMRHMEGEKLPKQEIESRIGSRKKELPDYEVIGSTAFIPVQGIISKKANLVSDVSTGSGTSVEEIERNFKSALKDKSVEKIVLDIDSPGGSVDGVAELSDLIHASKGTKPILAYADGQMASAAYWIGSSADKIYATKSSEVGSIGVYSVLRDFSVLEHNQGIKTEIVKAGKFKASGHPSKPLTEDDKREAQEKVDRYYGLFTEAVQRNRGMSSERIAQVATGKVFIGKEALEQGLIDGISSKDELATSEKTQTVFALNIQTQTNEEETMDLKTLTLEQVKTERPDLIEAVKKEVDFEAPKKEALGEERKRVTSILLKAREIKGVDDEALTSIQAGDSEVTAESKMKDKKLKILQTESPAPLGPGEETQKSGETHLDRARAYQRANGGSMTEALRLTAPKRNKARVAV